MAIDKHAFGATCVMVAMIYSSITYLHVEVLADQTSTKSTIYNTTEKEKHLLTAMLLRHPTLKSFLISDQKRRTGSASTRLNGDAEWTGKALSLIHI